jgi:HK97 family phage prohead protease
MSSIDVISKSGDRIIGGYCSVTVVDSENQLITKEALESALFNFMKKKQFRNIMLSHSAIQIGEVIPSYKNYKTHVDDYGMFILVRIRDDLETANEIWEQILNNELNGFSIHAEITKDGMHKEGDILVVDKLNLFEISITNSPVNELARFDIISKSKNVNNVKNVKNGGVKMAEDEKVELFNVEEEIDKIESIDSNGEDLELSTAEKSEDVETAVETVENEVAETTNPEIIKSIEDRVKKLEKQMAEILKLLKKYPSPGMYPYPEKKSRESGEFEKSEKSNDTEETKLEMAELINELREAKSNEKFANDIAVIKKAISERDTVVKDITKEFGDLEKVISGFDERIKNMENIPQRKTQVDFKDETEGNEVDPLIQVENGEIYSL